MATEPPGTPSKIVPSEKENVIVSVEPHSGAIYHALHVSRTVRTYPIQEHELYALDDLGGNSTLWTAIGSAASALFVSCVWTMICTQPPATTTNAEKGFALLLLVVAFGAFIIGASYRKKRKSRLEKIMSECE